MGGRLTVLADLTELRDAERLRADLMESERVARERAVAGQRFSAAARSRARCDS